MAHKKPQKPEDHPIDKLFRDSLENRDFPYDEKYWTEAEKTLADFNAKAGKRRGGKWLFGGIAITIVATLITIFIVKSNKQQEETSQITKNTIQQQDLSKNIDDQTIQKEQNDKSNEVSKSVQQIKHKDAPVLRDEMRKKLREKRDHKLKEAKQEAKNNSDNSRNKSVNQSNNPVNTQAGNIGNSSINPQNNANKQNVQPDNNDSHASTGLNQQDKSNTEASGKAGGEEKTTVTDNSNQTTTNDQQEQHKTGEKGGNTEVNPDLNQPEQTTNGANELNNKVETPVNIQDSVNQNNISNGQNNPNKPSQFKTRKSTLGLQWHIGLQGGVYHTSPQFKDVWNYSNVHIYPDPNTLFPAGEVSFGMMLPKVPFTLSSGIGLITMQDKSTYQINILNIDTTYDYITDTSGLVTDSIPLLDSSYATYYNETPNKLTYVQIPLLIGYEWTRQSWHIGIATGPVIGLKLGDSGIYETLVPTTYYDRVTWYWKAEPQVSYSFNEHWRLALQGNLQWQLSNTYLDSQIDLKFGLQGLQIGVQYDF